MMANIILQQDITQDYIEADPDMVEYLADTALSAMESASVPDVTTVSEILSAQLLMVDRTLRAVRLAQDSKDRFVHAKQIARALTDILVNHGRVPS